MTGWSLLLALGWAATAPPAPIPLRIEFEAPSGCSSAESFYAGVRARTSRVRRAGAAETGVHLRVRLTRGPTDVHGELRGFDERGETETRRVNGETCEEVVEALSLTAALALDPNARFAPTAPPLVPGEAASGEEPSGPGPSPPQPEPGPGKELGDELPGREEPELDLELDEPSRDAGRTTLFAELGAHTLAMNILTSELSIGGALFLTVGATNGWFSPSVRLSLMQVRNDLLGSTRDANAALTGAALTACALRLQVAESVRLEPCAHAIGGSLEVAGRNITRPQSARRTWWSAGPRVRAAAALGSRLALELELGLDLPLVERRFITTQPNELVAETPSVSPLAALGIAYLF